MALDPNIILRGAQSLGAIDPAGQLTRGAQAVGIFQQLRNEQQLAPVRQQLLQEQAAAQGLVNTQRQLQIAEAGRKRDLQGLASSYLEIKGLLDKGSYTKAADVLDQRRERLLAQGQTEADVSDTEFAASTLRSGNPEAIATLIQQGQGVVDAAEAEGLVTTKAGRRGAAKQRGAGALEGYVFDPDTGVYTIDPVIKDVLAKKAEKAIMAGKQIDLKTKQSINKDLTGILKDTIKIKRSAEELDRLEELKSPAAKLGAVFKFMKALDPTSVVRETEQGQVYAASGAAAQLAGSINSLLGEGKLTDKGFRDLVRTSKSIADANIESVSGEVSQLLDTFGDSLPVNFREKLEKRVPETFTSKEKVQRFQEGQRIVNPTTGERMEYRNGQWQPI